MADRSVDNGAAEGSERLQLPGNSDSIPAVSSATLDLDVKGTSKHRTLGKRKRASMDKTVTYEEKMNFIEECQHELDGLLEFYKEISSSKLHIEEECFTTLNSVVAYMLEEKNLSFSALVNEIYGNINAKEGNQGTTLASIRSAVLFVGQRVMYGIAVEDADVLEDVSEKCLWCWEARDMKLLPKAQRGFFSVRRMARKKIHERISALSTTISSLSVRSNEIHEGDLIRTSQRLQKSLNLSEICSLVEKLKFKVNAEMAQKEAKLKEKELIKELERNKKITETERKRFDQEIQKELQQTEKEQKRLREETAAEEKRLEKQKADLTKQLKKQEVQAKRDQQLHEKKTAELKQQLKIQKQAIIMERFLKRTKVNNSFDLAFSKEALISEAPCKADSTINTTSMMDNALLLHESIALEDLRS